MNPVFPSLVRWFQKLSPARRALLTILLFFSGGLVLSFMNRSGHIPTVSNSHALRAVTQAPENPASDSELKSQWERIKTLPSEPLVAVPQDRDGIADWPGPAAGKTPPYIAQAAEVAVATREFKKSRSGLEEILERHHAYAAKLRMVGQPSGSTLMATLRVPSPEFSAAVDDLKALGSVEREEQTADEITAQRANVEARLRNAQNTLAKLKEMLEQGWKAGNPAEIQKQLSGVSVEVARLQAEKTATDHRVLFSQVLFSLREEVQPPVVSLAAQFRNAALSGFSDLVDNVSAIALFVIGRGPVVLLWVALIYFPSRWAWRKWRPVAGTGATVNQAA